MRQHGADAAGMTDGLLDRVGMPALSAREKERHDLNSLLRALGVHHVCMGAANIQLSIIWLQCVPMAAQIACLSIAIPKGGFNQQALCSSQFIKV